MNYQLIEINKLEKSSQNARRTVTKGAAEEMKASIIAHGLMHNLVVIEGDDGNFHVTDGARRLEALKALQKDGALPADYAVTCQVRSRESALETSLAANTVRLAMHPADEFEAFARLAADGLTPEQIAHRFGKSIRYVEQRLKLGNADAKLLKEYRAEQLTLECLMAFTITDDRKRQMKIYRLLKDSRSLNPRAIRDALTDTMAEADSKLAKFVTLDAYRAAGGTTQSDLFSEAVYLQQPDLLNDLAANKLNAIEQQLTAEGWGWIAINAERDYAALAGCGRIHAQPADVPAELAEQRQRIAAELDALGEQFEEAVDYAAAEGLREQHAAAEQRYRAITQQIDAMAVYDPNHLRLAGCYVSIDHDGALRIEKGLVTKQDLKQLAGDGAKEKKPKAMPDALKRDLQAYRLHIAQAEISRHRLVVLDLLIFSTARSAFGVTPRSGLDVLFTEHRPAVKEQSAADHALKAIEQALPLAWLKQRSEAEQFRHFSYLSDADKLNLLAYCVATSLKPQLSTGHEATAYEVALSLTGADVAGYWRPTVANYLGRITRDQLLALGGEMLGEAWAQSRHRDKKGELAAQLERTFAEPDKYGRTPEQIGALSRWLPAGMAFTAIDAGTPKAKKRARKAA